MTADLQRQIDACLSKFDGPFGIAVSGGGDSMALLHLVAARVRETALPGPHVITVDHGLRADAAQEAEFVARTAQALGLPHRTLTWTGWNGTGNLQASARAARYHLLADDAQSNGLQAILLGHTADDVAETFLMRLARGSGIAGLAAMDADFTRHGQRFLRPALHAKRASLRDYLSQINADWIEDPSNEDPRFDRVKIRAAFPALAEIGLSVDQLSATAHRLADAQAVVRDAVCDLASHCTMDRAGTLLIAQDALEKFHHETQHGFWGHAFQWTGSADYRPRADAVAACIARATKEGRAQLAGCELTYATGTFHLRREPKAVAGLTAATDAIWDKKWQFAGPYAAGLIIKPLGEGGLRQVLDWRTAGLARDALLVSPAIYQQDTLVAAPLAGLNNGWSVQIVADFHSSLQAH